MTSSAPPDAAGGGATLYRGDAITLDVVPMPLLAETDRMVFRFVQLPGRDEIDKILHILFTWMELTERKLVFHFEQSDEASGLDPPDLSWIMCVVGHLGAHRDVLKKVLRGTCLQVRNLDERARAAKDLFLSVYTPVAKFDIVQGAAEAEGFFRELRREAKGGGRVLC